MIRIISIVVILFCAQNCFSQVYVKFEAKKAIFSKYSFSLYMTDFSDKNVRQFPMSHTTTFIPLPCDSIKAINLFFDADPGFVTGVIINCGDSIIADLDKNTFQIFKRKP